MFPQHLAALILVLSIAVPSHALGLAAGRLLRQRLEGTVLTGSPLHFPVELKARASTGGLAR